MENIGNTHVTALPSQPVATLPPDTATPTDMPSAGIADTLSQAMQSVTIENEKMAMQQRSEEAQQEWVNQMTISIAKQAAYDEDTFKKMARIGTELFRDRQINPLNEMITPLAATIGRPEKDVYIIVIAADNLDVPDSERLTATDIQKGIETTFAAHFGRKQGWRMALMSLRNSAPFTEKFLANGGLFLTFFRTLQAINAARASLLPTLFKTAERPKRVVNPTRPYQPQLYRDPEVY